MKTYAVVLMVFGIALSLAIVVIAPLLYAVGGYFSGWLLSVVFPFAGQWIVRGASSFGFEIPLTTLPVIGALLAFVGSFFRSSQSNSNKSK